MTRIFNRLCIWFNAFAVRVRALSRGSWISLGATLQIHAGATFRIGRRVRVMPNAVISVVRDAVLNLSDDAWIGPGVVIYCAESIDIGDRTRIAHYSTLIDHNYDVGAGTALFDAPRVSRPQRIGKDAWLGAYTTVLCGGEVGDHAITGAMTLVRGRIPPWSIAYCKSNSMLTIRARLGAEPAPMVVEK